LTAYDLARAKGHVECVELLQQHGAKSAVDCGGRKVRHEALQVVQQAHDAAAREAQYWITDELQLQQRAADVVATTINNVTASLTALPVLSNDDNSDDDDKKQRPRKVRINDSILILYRIANDGLRKAPTMKLFLFIYFLFYAIRYRMLQDT